MRPCSIAAIVSVALVTACTASTEDPQARQEQVAERGASVMPFDLDKTTHRFLPTTDGLREEVVADQAGDTTQIDLIRQHLTSEAQRFRTGDFGDPARIHGEDMPGLAALSAGAAKIEIAYADLPDGAVLTFRTTEPELVRALHDWGEAQVTDHGKHAEHGR